MCLLLCVTAQCNYSHIPSHPQPRRLMYINVNVAEDVNRTARCCPVSERLAKQLSKKNFRFIRINWKAPMGKFLLS